ncbi:hypothetical protein NB689_003571 [Xanthomonas sacchari]|nr:hypothetical protein [Xanthomonas sacchari]
MPIGSEYGAGRRSVRSPISGWNSEAVIWYVRVIRPTWAKLSWNWPFSTGYSARISDCIMSLIRCEEVIAARTPDATLRGATGAAGEAATGAAGRSVDMAGQALPGVRAW